MAEENSNVEVSDRGLFGLGKKDEVKNEEEVSATGVENLSVEESPVEKKEEEKKESLRPVSDSSSSNSSSDEKEDGQNGVSAGKKTKKKLEEKIKEKLGGDKKDETVLAPSPLAAAPVASEHFTEPEDVKVEPVKEGEKKGFLEKIKDILPGNGAKKETAPAPEAPLPVSTSTVEIEEGEKEDVLGKNVDKISGYHNDEKEADKTTH